MAVPEDACKSIPVVYEDMVLLAIIGVTAAAVLALEIMIPVETLVK